MPVITVVAAALPSAEQEHAALAALNREVALALGLVPDDVFSVHVPAGAAVLGASSVAPWPVVTLHGVDRGADASTAASTAAAQAVATAWQCDADEVWVQWLIRAEPAG